MGTRCVTVVQERGKDIMAMYRQMDGGPDGHGKELAEFLQGKRIINGIPFGKDNSMSFNGMGCLAASLVAHFKTEIGGFYLVPLTSRGDGAYLYTVYDGEIPGSIKLRVESCGKTIYDGYVDDFSPEDCREDDE